MVTFQTYPWVDVEKAIEIARGIEKWTKISPSKRC